MNNFTRSISAGVAAGAVSVSALVVPRATAQDATTTDMTLPLACYVQPKGSAAFARTSLDLGNDFALSFKATAPETVQVGEEFEYVIDPGSIAFPNTLSAQGKTVAVKRLSQANLWIDLPDNAELVSIDFDKNTPRKFSVLEQRGRLRFVGEQRRTDAKQEGPIGFTGKPVGDNPAEWVEGDEDRWFYGGAEVLKPGDEKLPKVTLTLKATGEPGSTVRPTIRKTDAKSLNPEAFVQGLVQGSTRVPFLGERNINALVRCGLSEDYTARGAKNAPATPFLGVKIVEKKEEEPPAPVTTSSSEEPTPETTSSEATTSSETPSEEPTTTTSETSSEEPTTTTSSSSTEPTSASETTSTTTSETSSEESTTSTTSSEPTSAPESTTTTSSEPTSEAPTTTSSSTTQPAPAPESTTTTSSEPTSEVPTTTRSSAEPTPAPETTSTTSTKPSSETTTPTTPSSTTQPAPVPASPSESTTGKPSPSAPTTVTVTKTVTATKTVTTTKAAPTTEPTTPATESTTPTTTSGASGSGQGFGDGSANGSSEGSANGSSEGSAQGSSTPVVRGLLITIGVLAGLVGLVGLGNWLREQGCEFIPEFKLPEIKLPVIKLP